MILIDLNQVLLSGLMAQISNQKNVKLDKYFITCFKKAKEVWKNTNGTFDPTVYSLVNAWGFGPGKKQKIEQKRIDSILKFVGFNLIDLKNNELSLFKSCSKNIIGL